MAHVVIVGTHPVAVDLRSLIRADPDLEGANTLGLARFVVDVRATPMGSVPSLHLGARLSPTEHCVLDMLLRLEPQILVRAGDGLPNGDHIVLAAPLDLSEALRWNLAHGLYRGLLRAALVKAPWWGARLRSWAAGETR